MKTILESQYYANKKKKITVYTKEIFSDKNLKRKQMNC